jgi:hypothetical protein
MIISYDVGIGEDKRITAKAKVTYEHPCARYDMPVAVLEDGAVFDWMSWALYDCKAIEASEDELEAIEEIIAGIIGARLKGLGCNVKID